jgi:hypothetical protein
MKCIKFILFLTLIIGADMFVFGQTVNNINVVPRGNTVEVTYDLIGEGLYDVKLFFSDDSGKTWKGPLKLVSGDVGVSQKKGVGKKILWDAVGEQHEFEGFLQFKIIAELILQPNLLKINDATALKLKKLQQRKTLWAVSTVLTAGIGAYSLTQTGKLYEQYKGATDNAADIRAKIETMNLVGPIALGLAGFSALEFILQSGKYKKSKKLALGSFYVPKGAGLSLSLNF